MKNPRFKNHMYWGTTALAVIALSVAFGFFLSRFELVSGALGKIASIFRAGCIIQAVFLNDITKAFETRSGDGGKPENLIFDRFFLSRINEHQDSLRKAVSTGVMNGLPIPALCNAISYLDEFCGKAVGANLIQAQRDCFGAHTYERTDREGTFHHEWRKANDN